MTPWRAIGRCAPIAHVVGRAALQLIYTAAVPVPGADLSMQPHDGVSRMNRSWREE